MLEEGGVLVCILFHCVQTCDCCVMLPCLSLYASMADYGVMYTPECYQALALCIKDSVSASTSAGAGVYPYAYVYPYAMCVCVCARASVCDVCVVFSGTV